MVLAKNGESQSAILTLWLALYKHLWIVLPIAIVVRFLIHRYASPLRQHPGPFLASGSRLWKGNNSQICVGG